MAQESRKCRKCGKSIIRKVWINNKRINTQNRKYCFECSPFGSHNTSKLETVKQNGCGIKLCVMCGKEHCQKGKKCGVCNFNHRKTQTQEKISIAIGGFKCCICGYDKLKQNLCFHHVNPSDKSFNLSSREMMLKWDRVWAEMQKCVLVCSNCHGEIHAGGVS